MAMQKREKILIGATAAIMVALAGVFLINGSGGASTGELQRTQKKLQADLDQYKSQIAKANRLQAQLKGWQDRSLPVDRALAQSLYQSWLSEIMEKNRLRGTVKPGEVQSFRLKSSSNAIYNRFPFSVSFQCTQEQLVRFLHAFYSSSNLDQILHMGIKPQADSSSKSSGSSGQLDVGLTVEAMSIEGISRHDKLSNATTKRLAQETLAEYMQTIGQRRIFAPYAPTTPPPPPNIFDMAQYIYLTAVTEVDGRLQAWFQVRPSDQNFILNTGEKFKAGDYEATVARIGQREADLEIMGTIYRMALGSSLRDSKAVVTEPTSAVAKPLTDSATEPKPGPQNGPPVIESKLGPPTGSPTIESKPSPPTGSAIIKPKPSPKVEAKPFSDPSRDPDQSSDGPRKRKPRGGRRPPSRESAE